RSINFRAAPTGRGFRLGRVPSRSLESRPVRPCRTFSSHTQGYAGSALGYRISPHSGLSVRSRNKGPMRSTWSETAKGKRDRREVPLSTLLPLRPFRLLLPESSAVAPASTKATTVWEAESEAAVDGPVESAPRPTPAPAASPTAEANTPRPTPTPASNP